MTSSYLNKMSINNGFSESVRNPVQIRIVTRRPGVSRDPRGIRGLAIALTSELTVPSGLIQDTENWLTGSKRSEPNQPLFQNRGTKPTGLGMFGRFNRLTTVPTMNQTDRF